MNDDLRVGIVGFGGAGMANYLRFQAIDGCEVRSVFDPKEPGLRRANDISKSLFLTNNFEDFLKSKINVVAICSPDKSHAEYMVQSLEAGKHCICEKPLADSIDGCKRILQAERQAKGCVASVQHQMRFLPLHVKQKELIGRGELGKIFYIEGYYVHNLTERANKFDSWRFEDNATPLVYSGCHFVDLLRWFLEDEVVEISGMANNISFPEYPESDLNVILMRFNSGVIGKVITAFGAARPQDHSVRVYGSEKCIENNLLFERNGDFKVISRPLLTRPATRSSGLKRKLGNIWYHGKEVGYGRLFEMIMKSYGKSNIYSISNYPMRLYEHPLAVERSIRDFIRVIRAGGDVKCAVLDAAKTVATCLAGVEAYRTGTTVRMKDFSIT